MRLGKRQREMLMRIAGSARERKPYGPIWPGSLSVAVQRRFDRLVELGLCRWLREPGEPAAYVVPTEAGVELVSRSWWKHAEVWRAALADIRVPRPLFRVSIKPPRMRELFYGTGPTLGDAVHDATARYEEARRA